MGGSEKGEKSMKGVKGKREKSELLLERIYWTDKIYIRDRRWSVLVHKRVRSCFEWEVKFR